VRAARRAGTVPPQRDDRHQGGKLGFMVRNIRIAPEVDEGKISPEILVAYWFEQPWWRPS